MCDIEAEDSG